MLYIDTETTGLNPRKDKIRLFQYCYADGEASVIDMKGKEPKVMLDILEGEELCGHNLKFDLGFIRQLHDERPDYPGLFDTMIASQLTYASLFEMIAGKQQVYKHNLALVANRLLGIRMDKTLQKSDWTQALTPAQLDYAAEDVRVLPQIMDLQGELLRQNGLIKAFQIEMDCLPAIVEMEVMGMPFNTTRAEEVRVQLAKEIFKLENALKIEAATKSKKQQTTLEGGVAGTINLNSPKQIKDYLNSRGHNLESTAKDVLQTIVDPWVDRFLEFRKLERLYKFVETWQEEYVEDGRLYPSYWQAKTRTGRMTSSDPNIQQVPKRERGKELRNIFQAAPGYKIVKSDFAGIELRIMATLTGDKVMLELFKNNADLHKYMAAKVSNKTEDEITKDERTHAKIINFGFIYGMGAPRFKEYALELYRVNLSDEEAQRYRTTFFKAYPEIATWHREEANKLRNNRVVPWKMYTKERGYYDRYLFVTRTLSGRARVFPIVKGKIEAQLPEVLNMPDQGTGADLLKVSLARVYREMVNENVKLIAAVHDEIVLEVREDLAMDAGVQLRRIMVEEGNKMLSPVPVDAEVTVGDSW